MRGKLVLIFFLLAGASEMAVARSYYQAGHLPHGVERHVKQPGPAAILKRGLARLVAFADQDNRPSKKQIAMFLNQEIAPYFDFSYMARWVGGKEWRRMTPARKAELEQRLQRDFLGTLAQRLTSYGGQQVRVLRPRARKGNEVDVAVAVQNPGGYPARLNFRFYRSNEGWKVFDVSANGNSAVAYYRQNFKRMMRRGMATGPGYPGRR
jgi:phospholipid transport system substrate-binding protein